MDKVCGTWKIVFTGWADVGLSERGIEEARVAGQALLAENYRFDRALTSVLKRSIHTLWIAIAGT